jgi:hypothetical protein
MASVFIDIPGVGNVEAKNAATESTLLELVRVMQGFQKTLASKGAKGKAGEEKPADKEQDSPAQLAAIKLGKAFGAAAKVVGGFAEAMDTVANTLSGFANVGDSLEKAADRIPILGTTLGAVASAAVKTNDALLSASKSGAGFGGSIQQFSTAASAAGMTMTDFGQMIKQNGEGMLGFGGTTEEGAKRFSQVSKALRTTSSDLYALGFSTADINQGLASYGALMRTQGLQGKQSNEQMVNGAKTYLKELDAMAKITGEERSAKESQMKTLAQDAQFQASMAGKSAEARQSFLTTVGKIPGPLQGFVKDFLATGTLTTEETQRIGAMMGGDVMRELNGLRSKLQSGAVLSAEEQDRLGIIMKRAAEQQLKNAGTSLAGATEMQGAVVAVSSALGIQEGAVKKTAEEQRAAALEASGFNKKIQESQQRLAEFSNGFQIALANSGMIDFLMDAFSVMATLVQTFVVPAFQLMATVLPGVVAGLVTYLGLLLYKNKSTIIELAQLTYKNALEKVGLVLTALKNAPMLLFAIAIGGLVVLFKKLGGDLQVFKDGFKVLGSYFTEFGQNLTLLYYKLMAKITPGSKYEKLAEEQEAKIKATQDERKELVKGIADRMKANRAANAHDSKNLDEKKRLDAEKNKIDYGSGPEALLKQFSAKEGGTVEMGIKKQEFSKDKEAADKQLKEAKTTAEKKAAIAKIEEAEKKIAALDKALALAKNKPVAEPAKPSTGKEKQEKPTVPAAPADAKQKQEKPTVPAAPSVPSSKQEAAKKGEGAKQELEQKGQAKSAADEKAKAAAEERARAEEKAKEENNKKGKGSAPVQESAETLLASLNTKMEQLIKISKGTHDVNERQLSVQKGLTSDLFAA